MKIKYRVEGKKTTIEISEAIPAGKYELLPAKDLYVGLQHYAFSRELRTELADGAKLIRVTAKQVGRKFK